MGINKAGKPSTVRIYPTQYLSSLNLILNNVGLITRGIISTIQYPHNKVTRKSYTNS